MSKTGNKPVGEKKISELWQETKEFFHDFVDLQEGMDQEGTLANIQSNISMKGANAWLLMCSIVVASLGLDLNSPAVIIGAMLISPLMSPILGIGLGIGINDKQTMIASLQHFGIAIAIALMTSFIYFKLSPFGQITDEIMSRTSPTLLDGLVAIFGGLAGVISITRMDKSNAIPGVAIATALMPPLCVAGFGLAKGEWAFFLNAFYLFFLNSSFIAITTYIIIRLLRFPYKEILNDKESSRNRLYITVFSLIILIPASIILIKTVKKVAEQQKVAAYLKEKIENDETILSDWTFVDEKRSETGDTLQLILKIIGDPLSQDDIRRFDADLEVLLGKPVHMTTYQSEEIPIDDINKLEQQVSDFFKSYENLQAQKNAQINVLNNEIDSLKSLKLRDVYQEVEKLFPSIEEIGISRKMSKSDFKTTVEMPIVLVKWKPKTSPIQRHEEAQLLTDYILLRINIDTLQIIEY